MYGPNRIFEINFAFVLIFHLYRLILKPLRSESASSMNGPKLLKSIHSIPLSVKM